MPQSPIPSEAIVEVATRALNSAKGLAIDFGSTGQATYWVQRFNTVKAAQTKKDPASEWRTLSARRVGSEVFIEPVDAFVLRLPIREL